MCLSLLLKGNISNRLVKGTLDFIFVLSGQAFKSLDRNGSMNRVSTIYGYNLFELPLLPASSIIW